jgi:hypothetical protein
MGTLFRSPFHSTLPDPEEVTKTAKFQRFLAEESRLWHLSQVPREVAVLKEVHRLLSTEAQDHFYAWLWEEVYDRRSPAEMTEHPPHDADCPLCHKEG